MSAPMAMSRRFTSLCKISTFLLQNSSSRFASRYLSTVIQYSNPIHHGRHDIIWNNHYNEKSMYGKNVEHPTFTLSKCYGTVSNGKCWKCGKSTDLNTEMFFCGCGVVQSPPNISYFMLLGVEENFDVDLAVLSKVHKDLQKLLHPDKYSQKSMEEKQMSEMQSSRVNKAYFTLIKPLPRALYMLELRGQALEEDNSDVDQQFLMEIMEVNEELADANSEEEIQDLEKLNDIRIKNSIEDISIAFKNNDVVLAKKHVIKLKYFDNIGSKIKEIYRANLGNL